MNVLIACECSGIVRDAFDAKGHLAVSCDLLPSERPGIHYQGDVRDILDCGWDLMIAHPPCTYFAKSGMHYLKTQVGRPEKLKLSFDFWLELWNAPIPLKAFENPAGWLNTHWMKPTQIVQPYFFGDSARKETCLWLHGVNSLIPTDLLPAPPPKGYVIRKSGYLAGNRYNYHWRAGKSAHRRSRTFQGIADAMAEQWGAE